MAKPTKKQIIGRLGEDIAVKHLENKGFLIIMRNYLKKCGEIDIIAKKASILHFVEVKTVSHENFTHLSSGFTQDVSHETDKYSPEDNLHRYKLDRIARTIQVYLAEKYTGEPPEWQFHAVMVEIDQATKRAKVKFIENVIL